MFIKKYLLTVCIGGALLSVGTASADQNLIGGNCLFYQGPYVGVNLGWAKLYNDRDNDFNNAAGGLVLGYDFTRNFATELSYNRLPHATNLVDVAARLNVPVSDYVSLFGKAGPAWVNYPHSGSKILPEAGVGVAFLPAHNTKVQLGYTHVFGHHSTASVHYVSVGVAYKFNT